MKGTAAEVSYEPRGVSRRATGFGERLPDCDSICRLYSAREPDAIILVLTPSRPFRQDFFAKYNANIVHGPGEPNLRAILAFSVHTDVDFIGIAPKTNVVFAFLHLIWPYSRESPTSSGCHEVPGLATLSRTLACGFVIIICDKLGQI